MRRFSSVNVNPSLALMGTVRFPRIGQYSSSPAIGIPASVSRATTPADGRAALTPSGCPGSTALMRHREIGGLGRGELGRLNAIGKEGRGRASQPAPKNVQDSA